MEVLYLLDIIDDDEENADLPRQILDRSNPFNAYDDESFRIRYNLRKEVVRELIELLQDRLYAASHRNNPLPPHLQVSKYIFQY